MPPLTRHDLSGDSRPLRRCRRSWRRGYVLVVTLALLVLCATVLAGIAQASLRHAIAARAAEDQLQHRWGVASCRRATLPYAEQILAQQERRLRRPVPIHRAALRLGEQQFDLIVGDEQAKANVNVLLADAGTELAQTRLRQALSGTGLAARLILRPDPLALAAAAGPALGEMGIPNRPATRPATQPALVRSLTGLGQVFDNVPPQRLLRSGAVDWITCWGGGAINARRAGEPALKLIASPPLTALDVGRLLQARAELFNPQGSGLIVPALPNAPAGTIAPAGGSSGTDPVQQFLGAQSPRAQAGGNAGVVGPGGREGAAGHLTATSACHSVWILTGSPTPTCYDLAVLDESDPQQPRTYSFQW